MLPWLHAFLLSLQGRVLTTKFSKTSVVEVKTVTHRSKFGIFSLVGVVIQRNEVESRLNLITATPKHVIFAHTLTAHRITPFKQKRNKVLVLWVL